MTTTMFVLYVQDQDASAAFYGAVFGAEPVLHVPGMTEFRLPGGASLGLMPERGITALLPSLPDPTAGGRPPRAELYLPVDDVDVWHQRCRAAGATELSPPALRGWGDRVGYCLDPDGHVLALAAPAST